MLIILAVLCGLIEAVFTALEVALGSVSRARLRSLTVAPREETPTPGAPVLMRRAQRALNVVERPDRLALLFITVTSLSLWGAATFLTWAALQNKWPLYSLSLALVVLLFVAEVVPLQIAARHGEAIALRGSPLVAITLRLLAPVLAVVGGFAYAVARTLGSGPNATAAITEGELRTALVNAEKQGVIESGERALIEDAMDFRDKIVREVMTPRIDIIGVSASASLSETLEIALREGHSRLPIFDGTLDKIVGILAAKDLLPHLKSAIEDGATPKTARDMARPAYFVPENKKIASTLEELRRQRTLLAMVVDSDGGTAGLVTLEDLLEELVGEIQDEYDLEEPALRLVEGQDAALLCEASSTVREFARFWTSHFRFTPTLLGATGDAAESGQSLASLALDHFENVPAVGDCVAVGEAIAATPDIRAQFALMLEVTKMDGPRIEEVKIALATEKAAEKSS